MYCRHGSARSRGSSALLLGCLLLLGACSGGDGGCSTRTENRRVHEILLDRYYWYDRVPDSVSYASFSSPQKILEYLRYSALDRFSYIASQQAFDNLFNNGTYIGYGFAYGIEDNGDVFVRFAYTLSPAGNAGLERGDQILAVNGQTVASISAAGGWGSVFGGDEIGLPLSLDLRRKSGALQTLNLVKATVTVNTVLHSEVIASGANTIGYLVFNSFLNTSPAELDPVFAQFKLAGVNRLILDLRYNGGGSIEVARDLASYIKYTGSFGSDLYVELRYNDKHQDDNFSFYFEPQANSLGLDQVAVITTESTCSASEQVVSALQPYLASVTTIGGRSCGKPVGMNPTDFCDLTMLAVNFASYNANDQGDYFAGIDADCSAEDDVGLAFGDPAEPMLAAARFFVDNQTCPPARRARPAVPARLEGLQEIAGAV